MNKAVFLDRDGVINYDGDEYYTFKVEDFIINDGIFEALSLFNRHGYMLIIISNQGGIGRGIYTMEDTERVHRHMLGIFKQHNIKIDEVYYCPHFPDNGMCLCRKPDSLMIEKALARFQIDPSQSFFIGDRDKDVEAANKAGIIPVKIEPNENLMNYLTEILGKNKL